MVDKVISQASLEFIVSQLESDDRDCSWQLALLLPQHKVDSSNAYQYWKDKQKKIRKALKELGGSAYEV